MRPAGRADQCPQLGVERTQRGPLLWAVHDPLRTSTAVANRRPVVRWLAYPLTDPREFDILHAVVVSGQRMPFDRLKRRDFIRLLGGATAAWPLAARAQHTGRVYRAALVFTTSPVSEMAGSDPIHPLARSFVQGLRALGYVQGQNLVLEPRSAEGKFERFPEITRELVSIKVDVIVTVANPMTQAAKDVTRTVPIVMAYSVSPVEHGVVQSLNRPGGNVTGLSMNVGSEIPGKQLQLLKELLPRISRVAFLHSKEQEEEGVQSGEAAAAKLGITLLPAEHTPTDYTNAFALIMREHPDALIVGASAVNVANRHLIVEFAAQRRLPVMYATREFVTERGRQRGIRSVVRCTCTSLAGNKSCNVPSGLRASA
jgi:putative tryptophan/tyrosine transport system substrate-binding protein